MSAQQTGKAARRRPKALRIFWRIMRYLLVPILCVGGLLSGLLVGYAYFGGQPAAEVFSVATWKHLVDLVFAN